MGVKYMYLEVKNIKKSYGENGSYMEVIKGISTSIEKGQICAILGPSGSGKSTFLNLIGGLDEIDFGSIKVDNKELFGLKQNELSEYRRENLGFVFQFYNLVPNLTVRENIEVCQYLSQNPLDINELLNTIGLKEHENKFPAQLSGGQQQRCAIARALIKNPKLLLCDEPTGALDSKTSKEILILIEKINKKFDTTILIVTHNDIIKNMAHKIIQIKDGKITKDYTNALKFQDEIDAAAVYVNASTRFTDGFEFGFGAEIGISTQKLHARGPMGLEALTTTKYVIFGDGQIRP